MGKSRAEIQRAYRQRLKEKNNEEYLRKERQRMKRAYVPSNELNEKDKAKRNKKNRKNLRAYYERKKESIQNAAPPDTSGYESAEDDCRFTVRMDFNRNKAKGAIGRWKRELAEARGRIRVLEEEKTNLTRKVRSAQRKLQRKNISSKEPMTPRKETELAMKKANLSSSQKHAIRKSLLLSNVLCKEIRSAKEKSNLTDRKLVHQIVAGQVLRKYKCMNMLSLKTGLCRHRIAQTKIKSLQREGLKRRRTIRNNKDKVEAFLKREDNSKMQPGKADCKKSQTGEKTQIHVLTDYLPNLYEKFKAENPDTKISLTSFKRCRPKYILTTSFSSRHSCLCTKHQNVALTLKTLRKNGIQITAQPDKAVENLPSIETLKESLEETVSTSQWTRVEVEEKGKKKSTTRIVESKVPKEKFIEDFEKQMEDFKGHRSRVQTQYQQIRELKDKIARNEIIVQLDFAENYSCRSVEEVQSAYFNQTSVTLHPMVAYFKDENNTLQHQSYIVVSDELAHKSSTVIAFIDEMMPTLKSTVQTLERIHYWSDSPTSQYRNKQIFDLIGNHFEKYGIMAQWNYFEAGHGKGPCDGLGGA